MHYQALEYVLVATEVRPSHASGFVHVRKMIALTSRRAASATACRARPVSAADFHTPPLVQMPCRSSCACHDLVPVCSSGLSLPSSLSIPHCCDSLCPLPVPPALPDSPSRPLPPCCPPQPLLLSASPLAPMSPPASSCRPDRLPAALPPPPPQSPCLPHLQPSAPSPC